MCLISFLLILGFPFIVSPSTAAITICPGWCRISVW